MDFAEKSAISHQPKTECKMFSCEKQPRLWDSTTQCHNRTSNVRGTPFLKEKKKLKDNSSEKKNRDFKCQHGALLP